MLTESKMIHLFAPGNWGRISDSTMPRSVRFAGLFTYFTRGDSSQMPPDYWVTVSIT